MPSAVLELTGRTWYMPFGRSVSSKNSAKRSAPIGVALAGFTTIGAPTASAGATLCATRFSGKLNGVMPSTGPIGNCRPMPLREPNGAPVPSRLPSPSPGRRASLGARCPAGERHHPVVDVRLVLERVDAHVLPVAGLFVPPMGHLGR